MRSFLAITFPNRVAERLAEIAAACPMGRAVPEENIHLTLAFLGEAPEAILDELDETLAAMRADAFPLTISGVNTFGGANPRAVWAGIAPEPRLAALVKRIEGHARRAGLELPHRRFVPHITLARFRNGTEETSEFRRYVGAHVGLSIGPVDIRSFGLFSSQLGAGGPQYEELARYPLA